MGRNIKWSRFSRDGDFRMRNRSISGALLAALTFGLVSAEGLDVPAPSEAAHVPERGRHRAYKSRPGSKLSKRRKKRRIQRLSRRRNRA